MVEDDWFASLPTAYQVLVNIRELLPEAVQIQIEKLHDDAF